MGNFVKIYFWQIISIFFNFGNVFIVTPFISSNSILYGVYSILMSAYLFISYADLGFLGAGMKYASESYARKDREEEMRLLGFTGIVFLSFVFLFSLGLCVVAYDPGILIHGISSSEDLNTAKSLFLVLALSCPIYVIQRIVQIIFAIRLMDFKFQRILILSNILKILSSFLFFGGDAYNLVWFFITSNVLSALAVIVGIYIAKKEFDYNFIVFFKSLRFSREIFQKTRTLAFTSLFLTVCWVLYYELDNFFIAKIFGANEVAKFAICLTVLSYFRALFGILYSPFISKFNQLIGIKAHTQLIDLFKKVLIGFMPIVVFPVLIVVLTADNFIMCWVGEKYSDSILITKIMLCGYMFCFITNPTGILVMAYEKVRQLYVTSALQPIVYWLGIGTTVNLFGLLSFAIFKFLAFLIESIVYIFILIKSFKIPVSFFLNNIVKSIILPILVIYFSVYLLKSYLPMSKGYFYLLIYFLEIGVIFILSMLTYYFTSIVFRNFVKEKLANFSLSKF
ncbi:hypothetical protein HMPREF0765_3213 [Sphingobacterium spiritivorum ATCC 33300]|uniref:Polysaccharide biosynthesis protein n=1 Tax=Sphingobacterium spiritivorum ATCC 33300 TaxID=525372 RepID=C2G0V7_SPHSI|nr:hypothetical protein [Sphingobacterium spiritivorum]EEI91187.1 hypothetical protein HMPREF0765_3213 [Sphingobacterium spiritivorum ATCC 33300]QQS97577.1 hypothetical protein I6J03_07685 [Sphingobacterium spiritivorum]